MTNKQETVYLLPLPFDIGNLTNDFLFIEIKTYFVENKKKEIIKKIKNGFYENRKNGHWAICLGTNEEQFQATNCIICGNYKFYSGFYDWEMASNMKCHCRL
jgi:hypothetical protein